MPDKITTFPGTNCSYFNQGACLFDEFMNPGLHEQWRCKVLVHWESAYDSFLSQADVFSLELGMASKIWEGRLKELMKSAAPCKDYTPWYRTQLEAGAENEEFDEDSVACVYSWVGLCVMRLPRCNGVCERYTTKPLPSRRIL